MERTYCPECNRPCPVTEGLIDQHLDAAGARCSGAGALLENFLARSRSEAEPGQYCDWEAFTEPPPPKCSGTIRGGH
jgi:hypothetical protein